MALVPLDVVQAEVLSACAALHPRAMPLDETLHCVTSVPIVAECDVPNFANTSMDGYAIRAADTQTAGARLKVVAVIAAGSIYQGEIAPGQAAKIMTGAPLPSGADAVVMVENTFSDPRDPDYVTLKTSARSGDFIRPAGGDIRAGQTVLDAFTQLMPAHLGVLASLGYKRVPVFPKARVGVLSTGDELSDTSPLPDGKVRDSNRHSLLAMVSECNGVPVDLGLVPDDKSAIHDALAFAIANCDAVVVSGGVSMGDLDYVHVVLDEMTASTMQWIQVAIRPARPLAFGVVGQVPVFGLPGNPVSSIVSFELFARPALLKMMGNRQLYRSVVDAVAGEDFKRKPDGKLHFLRVIARYSQGAFRISSTGSQLSNALLPMAHANALALVPDGNGVRAGEPLQAMLVRWP